MTSTSVTKKFTNISTENYFQFVFRCDRCDAEMRTEKYPFSTERFHAPPGSRAHALLWTRRHDEAYERANAESQLNFNYCPDCERWVCDDCFHVSSEVVTDICLDCMLIRETSGFNAKKKPLRKLFQLRRQKLKRKEDDHVSLSHKTV